MSVPCRARIEHKENLPLGNGSRGRFIPPSKDNMGILIPSWGGLEKEEVDYIAEASLEKEKNRNKDRKQKNVLERVTQSVLSAPMGKRRERLNEITGGVQWQV